MTAAPLDQLRAALADRYRLERELGQGGMATVYLAHDIRHERKVAIKVLRPELAAVIGAERFVREIRTIAALQHPHILGLIDSGEVQGTAYYVMPFVEGESLRERLTREKQLPVADAVRIATEVASALDYAHRRGVIHRDIKPENILLHDGQALVADFGIALAMTQAGGTRMTETGMSLGTPHYMSPEQAMGEREITARSDVYALGAVLYEMLSGEPPFTGPTAPAIVAKVMTDEPRPLAIHRKTVPPHVEAAVLTALAKLPADRFETAKQFAEALASPGMAKTAVLPAVSRRRTARGPVGVAGVLGFVAGVAAARLWAPPRLEPVREYVAERLGGAPVSLQPALSPDGKTVAFAAMEGRQSQVAVLNAETGDWKVLTHDSTLGIAQGFAWAPDGSRIYYHRFSEVPRGIYSISPLGAGDRLIMPDAASATPLADGSLLLWRYAGTPRLQLFHYWPDTGKLDTLQAYSEALNGARLAEVFPGGREAAFFGGVGPYWATDTLYAIDLATKKSRVLSATIGQSFHTTLAVTPDGLAVLVTKFIGDGSQIVSIPRDGSGRETVLLRTTSFVNNVAMGPDGSIYLDQMNRPAELVRYAPSTGRLDRTPLPPSFSGGVFPLRDGRVLAAERSAGRLRIAAYAPGTDPTDFLGSRATSTFPIASLGSDQVLVRLTDSSGAALVAASASTGSITMRKAGLDYQSLAGSPDGKTIFVADSGAIWSMPVAGGQRRRLAQGSAVATDPGGRYLVTQVIGSDGVRLLHVPLDGGAAHQIPVHGDTPVSINQLAPNAVATDGRIVVEVVSKGSWFWPAAILDPVTGKLSIVPPGLSYDMILGGWDTEGHVVATALGLECGLWRFRPVKPAEH
jgi:tRNA A-37 threonylcarbamoyl transferase component Bud32